MSIPGESVPPYTQTSTTETPFSYLSQGQGLEAADTMPPPRSSLGSRIYRTFVTYATIIVAFPFALIILMELLLAIRACLVAAVGLICFSPWGLIHYGLPPLPVVADIVSTYLKTAALGGTRFALMFAPSSLVVGVGAAIMHASGARWRPSHIARHLTIADPRTSIYGGMTSVICDIGVGSVFLPMGMFSFFGMQHGVGRGTGVAAEHPLVTLLIGMVGSAAVSAHRLLQEATRVNKSRSFSSSTFGDEKSLPLKVEGCYPNSRPSFIEELLPWDDIDRAFEEFSTRP